jgi:hypothetical protein
MNKGFALGIMAIVLVGCSTPSKHANDPRAAVVGPDYLDYIEQYPMDRDTQYYYPHFGLADAKVMETRATESSSSFPASISALMIQRPTPPPTVMEIEAEGWPALERDGIPF